MLAANEMIGVPYLDSAGLFRINAMVTLQFREGKKKELIDGITTYSYFVLPLIRGIIVITLLFYF